MGSGRRLIAIEAPQPYLSITWQVNNYCNYRCSYCNPGNWGGNDINDGNLDRYLTNLEKIINRYRDAGYKNFKFFFSGGEPTAWRNFIPICEWLYNELPRATLAVNTNLSRPLAWWEKHHYLFDDVVASFHIEFANKKKYEENSIFLCDKVNYLSTKMLLHDERFWEVVEYGNYLKTVMPNYFLEWTPLFDEMTINTGPWHYDDPEKVKFINEHTTEIQQLKPKPAKRTTMTASFCKYDDNTQAVCNSNEVIVAKDNFFSGWECNVGDCIFINPVGEMSLASCGQGGHVGHILEYVERVGPRRITCAKEHCHCGTDIIIPKYLPQE